jgi:UDP-N-acetylglucosamine--N-acetylmuramyl-(pentapeptide) pyrophosphoryl-undecaprenol N-acetylglucosamine transferase
MKILLVGGGSGGSVSPLLAVADEIKKSHPQVEFLFVGGHGGPERLMVIEQKIPFVAIVSGKYRRYFSLRNAITPFAMAVGFFQSLKILYSYKADCVYGTGSFVQVPFLWAAWVVRVPIVIHQQDVVPSLANRLCSWIANKITVTFKESEKDFSSGLGLFYKKLPQKVIHTGNPFRENLRTVTSQQGHTTFSLNSQLPVLLVTGGGTGAFALNEIIRNSLSELTKFVQVIHQTGTNKMGKQEVMEGYHPFEFITHMGEAYASADIVVCRAGISTLTELSNLAKIGIIIPMPDTHQEFNARAMKHAEAAIVLDQRMLTAETLLQTIRKVLIDGQLQSEIRKNVKQIMPQNAGTKIAEIIITLAESNF